MSCNDTTWCREPTFCLHVWCRCFTARLTSRALFLCLTSDRLLASSFRKMVRTRLLSANALHLSAKVWCTGFTARCAQRKTLKKECRAIRVHHPKSFGASPDHGIQSKREAVLCVLRVLPVLSFSEARNRTPEPVDRTRESEPIHIHVEMSKSVLNDYHL